MIFKRTPNSTGMTPLLERKRTAEAPSVLPTKVPSIPTPVCSSNESVSNELSLSSMSNMKGNEFSSESKSGAKPMPKVRSGLNNFRYLCFNHKFSDKPFGYCLIESYEI